MQFHLFIFVILSTVKLQRQISFDDSNLNVMKKWTIGRRWLFLHSKKNNFNFDLLSFPLLFGNKKEKLEMHNDKPLFLQTDENFILHSASSFPIWRTDVIQNLYEGCDSFCTS